MDVRQPESKPGSCDWCEADIFDFEEIGDETQIRLHGALLLNGAGGKSEHRRGRNHVKVKVQCPACGHANVVVIDSPINTLDVAPPGSVLG